MGSAAFGGLGLLWGSNSMGAAAAAQDGLLGPTMERMKIILFWSFFIVLVGALALVSNPTDASFRSYLTELSFRRHLRELHRPSPPTDADLDDFSPSVGHLNLTSTSSTNPRTSGTQQDSTLLRPPTSSDSTLGPSSTQASPSHLVPFRFANRVSISLRTPPYILRDFAFFSLVTVSPNQVLSVKGRNGAQKAASWLDAEQSESLLAGVWFIGLFGRWWMAGSVRSQMDPSAGEDEMRAGVIGLKALDGSEDPVAAAVRKAVSGTDSSSLNASPSSPSRSTTRAARPRSRRPSIETITISPPEKPSPPPPSTEHHHILPLHQQRPLIQQEKQQHQRTLSTSSADLHPPSSLPSSPSSDTSSLLPPIDPLLLSTNPALAELHTAFLASQTSTADLRSQLGQSSAASEAAQSQLQASLDGLRLRKREEDNDRLEVKSRTKALEDGKRQAETGKREADKKLKVTEGLRDAVLARIEVLTKQVNEAKEKMRVQREEMEGSNETIRKREGEVREETKSKREQLVTVEEGLGALGVEVKELDLKARDEEASLEVAKEEAVAAFEAEMRQQQSSFASFGAPQPRSVENDYYGQHSSSNPPPPPPSSSSHPTSLFDLPIQQLPLSLLHRRRQLTEPVASDFGPGLPAQVPSSFSLNDVFGFEDFGPGVPSQSRRYDYDHHQQDLASSNGHSYSNYSRPIPPSIHTDDYSTDEDPGSPGPMSASFTNLLPRGLFQSLSAEGLLSPDGFADPSSPFTAAFNRASLDSDESFLLDIDTETEQPGSRRLSLTDADIFFPADENLDEGEDQLFDMPQRTPSDTYLPSSPRSVFSDDPRSLLLDPYADENFSYPPPGIDSLTFANSTNLLDFVDRSSPTASSARPTSSHGHQSSTSDDPFLRQRPFAVEPAVPASVPAVPQLPSGIRTMEEVAEREPEDEDEDHVSPEIEHATTTTTTTLPPVEFEKPASKFTPKRWFSSNKVHAHVSPSPNSTPLPLAVPAPTTDASSSASSLLDPKLNPDAKAFSFKGFSALRGNSSSATGTTLFGGLHQPPSDLSVSSAPFVPSAPPRLSQESLLARPHGDDFAASSSSSHHHQNNQHPTSSPGGASNTSRFFSSLRAFAPSAAEREALTRALRQNGSSKSIDGFMGGSAADRGEASPTYQHASPYGYANGAAGGGGPGSGKNVGRGGGVMGSGRGLVPSASSPFATPQTSATNLVGDRRAAAAWDGPERPIVQVDQSVGRRKSFRFFNLASSFSRKQTSEEDLHLAAAGTIGHPRPANPNHDDSTVPPPSVAPSEARSSGATIVNDWAPPWKKEAAVVTPAEEDEDEDDASEEDEVVVVEVQVEGETEEKEVVEVGEKE
ncbi:hypothetical protein BDY24DRAFT_419017 [Mrakia frigida]|uniref:uncharacterized protein n=1 Tax=Mrakia frigida TaxID=29902 RepID=UPI003FCC1CA1